MTGWGGATTTARRQVAKPKVSASTKTKLAILRVMSPTKKAECVERAVKKREALAAQSLWLETSTKTWTTADCWERLKAAAPAVFGIGSTSVPAPNAEAHFLQLRALQKSLQTTAHMSNTLSTMSLVRAHHYYCR